MKFGSHPAQNAVAVTTSNTVLLPDGVCRALYIGVTGDVVLLPAGGGSTVTFKAVPVGILPVACRRVHATGTTANGIVALY